MTDAAAAKAWTIETELDRDRRLTFNLGDNAIAVTRGTSPVEQLLAAVGACFAQSCVAVMQFQGMSTADLKVSVRGFKPAGPVRGKGLNRIDVGVCFNQSLDPNTRDRILRDTKSVCTVTNTLANDVEIVVTDLTDDAPA